MAVGKNKTWQKAKQYNLPYNIKAVGKIIKWRRSRGTEILGNKINIFNNGGEEQNQGVGSYI